MAGETLTIPIGATVKDLERAMREASALSEKTVTKIEKDFGRMDLGARFGAGAILGAISALSLTGLVSQFAEVNKEIAGLGETAKRTGLDLERLQELRIAGRKEGLTGKQVDSGLEGLAKALNDSRRDETELSKLFDANNLKLKDRQGQVISVNQALDQGAELIRKAATEFDKIEIARLLGLTKDWVPLLEQGADGLEKASAAARTAGGIIDADVIAKAKEFDEKWTAAVVDWSTLFKSNLGGIIDLINSVIGLASQFGAGLANYSQRLQAVADIQKNGLEGAGRDTLNYVRKTFGADADPVAQRRLAEFAEFDREGNRAGAFGRTRPKGFREPGPAGNATVIPGKTSRGGGGGKDEDEKAQDRLERYIETLTRQNSVLDAQIATFGKSNAEKRAAVELAKAQVDLAKLDETQRQKIIASLTREIELSEQKRTQLEDLKKAQEGLRDAQKYFGDAAVDALEDLIVNGAKAEDVVKNLAKSLAKAALQATLMGSGPLAGILGLSGSNGSAGGLLGALFKGFGGGGSFSFGAGGYVGEGPFISGARAAGGPVSAGRTYLVGERGPELFTAPGAGKILPRIPTVSAREPAGAVTYSPVYSIDARGADQAAVARLERGLEERDRRFGRNVQSVMRQTDIRGTRA